MTEDKTKIEEKIFLARVAEHVRRVEDIIGFLEEVLTAEGGEANPWWQNPSPALLQFIYIIVDAQLVISRLELDEYIIGALMLCVDIV